MKNTVEIFLKGKGKQNEFLLTRGELTLDLDYATRKSKVSLEFYEYFSEEARDINVRHLRGLILSFLQSRGYTMNRQTPGRSKKVEVREPIEEPKPPSSWDIFKNHLREIFGMFDMSGLRYRTRRKHGS